MKEKEKIGKLDDIKYIGKYFKISEIRNYISRKNNYNDFLNALKKYGRERNENK